VPEWIVLPTPTYNSATSVEEALHRRRSIREYQEGALSLVEVSQLLWAAQGITHGDSRRTVPSAGALYPLEVYLLAGDVEGLPAGLYKYQPQEHSITLKAGGDYRRKLCDAAQNQEMILDAPASIVVSGIFARTTVKYHKRGEQYVHNEVGAVAQNLHLQAESLGLGTVFIGAFSDEQVSKALNLPEQEQPLAIFPFGRR
jgi:SagB-type dehydrogenase family enzyme